MPRYCSKCVLPETRPGVRLDEAGTCNGCRNASKKPDIDWDARASAFRDVAAVARQAGRDYDCIIPVSGGKDSYWQVVTCLEYGLRPLCVTYAYPRRTEIGETNLRNLIRIGVDHLDLHINSDVERRFIRKAFRKTSISGLVMHMAVYSAPIRLAAQLDIPLVVYGENSAFEYGSEDESLAGSEVDRRWLKTFGVTEGTTAADWVDDELSAADLAQFTLPPPEILEAKRVRTVFLGWFFPWSPENSLKAALAHGFRVREEGPLVGHFNYTNIDDEFLPIHHHPKWHKFGITRTWDTLSMDIRQGRITREEAVLHLADVGDETPWEAIRSFCEFLEMSQREYFAILEEFRNREIWSRRDGRWVIDEFLLPDYRWPEDPEIG